MGDIFNKDFQEFLIALNQSETEYILVGGYAVILHGRFRNTGDMDIWVNPTTENYLKLSKAFAAFGLPMAELPLPKFLNTTDFDVFSFGRQPVAIDIMTKVKGLDFEAAYSSSTIMEESGISIRVLHLEDLKKAKQAAGRHKDLDDLENL